MRLFSIRACLIFSLFVFTLQSANDAHAWICSVVAGAFGVHDNAQTFEPMSFADCSDPNLPSIPATMRNPVLISEIERVANNLGMQPSQLAGVIWSESGGDPTNYNQRGAGEPPCGPTFPEVQSSATGLIQFLTATARGLGMHNARTCMEHYNVVSNMGIPEQMRYVEQYYNNAGWQPGMNDYQAYATVHNGNPHGGQVDSTGVSTNGYFNRTVSKNIAAFRCTGVFASEGGV